MDLLLLAAAKVNVVLIQITNWNDNNTYIWIKNNEEADWHISKYGIVHII